MRLQSQQQRFKRQEQKGQLLGQNRAEVLFIDRGSGGQISQHKNCVQSLSNPKPMFSTVLELTTTRFMTDRRSKFAYGKISAFPRSRFLRCCLLFSLRARVYLTFPLTKTYGYGGLCDRCDYMETAFFAIVCDCLRSAICDLRSSAIVCDHMETSLKIEHGYIFCDRLRSRSQDGSQKYVSI